MEDWERRETEHEEHKEEEKEEGMHVVWQESHHPTWLAGGEARVRSACPCEYGERGERGKSKGEEAEEKGSAVCECVYD